MLVKLEIFRLGGKWYTDGKYETRHTDLTDIWNEVRALRSAGQLPGLIHGGNHLEFLVYVDVPKHPHRHPRLIV